MTCTVHVLLPAPAANVSCSFQITALINAAVLAAAASATTVAGGVPSCAYVRSGGGGARLLQSAPGCSGPLEAVEYSVPVIIAPGDSAAGVLGAVSALNSASFAAAAIALANASGCSTTAFVLAGVDTAAACGTGVDTARGACDLSPSQQPPAVSPLGPALGGALAAVLIAFVVAALALWGRCACCGAGCPQKEPTRMDGLGINSDLGAHAGGYM